MPQKQPPKDLHPTHEYRFTRTIKFQYNSIEHLVRVFYKDNIVQDWMLPGITVDLTKFELLPHPATDLRNFNDHYTKLCKVGAIPTFMAKWRQRLPADEYQTLLEDLRAAILFAEMDLITAIKTEPENHATQILALVSTF
jgi:hypothetical protein